MPILRLPGHGDRTEAGRIRTLRRLCDQAVEVLDIRQKLSWPDVSAPANWIVTRARPTEGSFVPKRQRDELFRFANGRPERTPRPAPVAEHRQGFSMAADRDRHTARGNRLAAGCMCCASHEKVGLRLGRNEVRGIGRRGSRLGGIVTAGDRGLVLIGDGDAVRDQAIGRLEDDRGVVSAAARPADHPEDGRVLRLCVDEAHPCSPVIVEPAPRWHLVPPAQPRIICAPPRLMPGLAIQMAVDAVNCISGLTSSSDLVPVNVITSVSIVYTCDTVILFSIVSI